MSRTPISKFSRLALTRAHHDLVAEHEFQVDPVGRHLERAVAAGDARQHQHAVLASACMLSKTTADDPVPSKIRSNGPERLRHVE